MHINNRNLPKKILSWYDNNKRILPWRITKNYKKKQYFRFLSEFMLQQTRVQTVIPYFKNFVKKIPNLKALSKSNERKVLKLWEGLGYYSRAKNLHKTSKILIKKHNGKIPKNFEKLKELPGIGDYTANVLLALIYNQPRIALDGNVKRVFSRLFNINKENGVNLFKTKRSGDLAEALMEFGALVCKPKNPRCHECKIKKMCSYYKFSIKIPSEYNWYSLNKNNELNPTFTKKIFRRVSHLYQ